MHSIIKETEMDLDGISLENYMWFAFEKGGSIETNFHLSADRGTSVDYLVCKNEEAERLKEDFDDEFCTTHSDKPY